MLLAHIAKYKVRIRLNEYTTETPNFCFENIDVSIGLNPIMREMLKENELCEMIRMVMMNVSTQ